ncbi:ATPase 4, plasma membrane-type, partial [Mucuna pruriens]
MPKGKSDSIVYRTHSSKTTLTLISPTSEIRKSKGPTLVKSIIPPQNISLRRPPRSKGYVAYNSWGNYQMVSGRDDTSLSCITSSLLKLSTQKTMPYRLLVPGVPVNTGGDLIRPGAFSDFNPSIFQQGEESSHVSFPMSSSAKSSWSRDLGHCDSNRLTIKVAKEKLANFFHNKLEDKKESNVLKILGLIRNPLSWVMEVAKIMRLKLRSLEIENGLRQLLRIVSPQMFVYMKLCIYSTFIKFEFEYISNMKFTRLGIYRFGLRST